MLREDNISKVAVRRCYCHHIHGILDHHSDNDDLHIDDHDNHNVDDDHHNVNDDDLNVDDDHHNENDDDHNDNDDHTMSMMMISMLLERGWCMRGGGQKVLLSDWIPVTLLYIIIVMSMIIITFI